ncbi:conserved hypothetical protein [Culex quinquefasciatus]|uniref:SAM domain-containing protein n=1 Tax=Culex quinquefasciatus TaxID=7176 RepID=B0WPD8_CULQU|nr:conserved hypothetical protein [Culex quinquefasciatus]|eukprot:XP_001850572.1 conserved hypothetical protein [Culex quinquefasciatus]
MIQSLEGSLVQGYRRKKLRLSGAGASEGPQAAADMELDAPGEGSFTTVDSVGECDSLKAGGVNGAAVLARDTTKPVAWVAVAKEGYKSLAHKSANTIYFQISVVGHFLPVQIVVVYLCLGLFQLVDAEQLRIATRRKKKGTYGSGSADGGCSADDFECITHHDQLGMEAIRSLHRQLDDDDNGDIDLSESDDFLREELKYDSGYEKRHKAFHFNDDMHISVKELWEAWLRSEVHNWTVDQTTEWLAQSVQLPQYVHLFRLHKVTGKVLPRMAVNNMHYVSNVLGIKDPIHKQKIALKAMDAVLFGPPRETGTRWKDLLLVTLLLTAIIGSWYAYQQNKNAKIHLKRMAKDVEGLLKAEVALQDMQKELERARQEQENVGKEKMDLERRLREAPTLSSSNSDLELQQLKQEVEMLRSELSRAEVEINDHCWTPPQGLQAWLQLTFELENKHHIRKRIQAEKQLMSAREACEKLKKKRSSLVGAFVSTHGKSIDDVDRSIVEARHALNDVTNDLQERMYRWKQIEQLLGFSVVNNNGLVHLENLLYNRNGGSGSKSYRCEWFWDRWEVAVMIVTPFLCTLLQRVYQAARTI